MGPKLHQTLETKENHRYSLDIGNGTIVNVIFPRDEKDLQTREYQIRNALQGVFCKMYSIDHTLGFILAHMNDKEGIEKICKRKGLINYLSEAKTIYDKIDFKTIEFDLTDPITTLKVDITPYNEINKIIKPNNKKLTEVLENNHHIYSLDIGNGTIVNVIFPRDEKDLQTREFQIRNALQGVFSEIYNVSASIAMIMANMNTKKKNIEDFCKSYGLIEDLPEAKKRYEKIKFKTIDFTLANIIPSLKLDGNYYRYSKFSNGKTPQYTTPANINMNRIYLDQNNLDTIFNRIHEMKSIFEEEVNEARKKYDFDLKIEEDINYYRAYIKTDDEVDGIQFPKGESKENPVFSVKVRSNSGPNKKYYIEYSSNYFGYNASDLWLLNDIALRDHIKKGLLNAIHYFTNNIVE